MKSRFVSSNWCTLQGKIDSAKDEKVSKKSSKKRSSVRSETVTKEPKIKGIDTVMEQKIDKNLRNRYVALDCEMVGLGEKGKESALARCCVVDFDGAIIYDQFVRPQGFVTDFRTKWSGIRKKDLRSDTAIAFSECQESVAQLLKGKILVGHALENDMEVLLLSHPRTMIRDTAKYPPYMRPHGFHGKLRPRSLKDLSNQFLGQKIQSGEHDPGEDARAAMMLYRLKMENWEEFLRQGGRRGMKRRREEEKQKVKNEKLEKNVEENVEDTEVETIEKIEENEKIISCEKETSIIKEMRENILKTDDITVENMLNTTEVMEDVKIKKKKRDKKVSPDVLDMISFIKNSDSNGSQKTKKKILLSRKVVNSGKNKIVKVKKTKK